MSKLLNRDEFRSALKNTIKCMSVNKAPFRVACRKCRAVIVHRR